MSMEGTVSEGLREPLLPRPAIAGSSRGPGERKAATELSAASKTNGSRDSPANLGKVVTAFVLFVAVRSFHPIVIDLSKVDGQMLYGKATPCVINSAVDVVIGNLLSFLFHGTEGLRQCWDPAPLKVFSAIAVAYAFGDFLEMQSMSVMGGAVYQILLQSKLLITALIMWGLRGQRQTGLQWNVLVTIMLGMSAFMLMEDGSSSSGGSGERLKAVGIVFVVAKVVFSCLCAVLAEKYLKAYGHMPIYMQVAQLKFSWLWVSLALTFVFDHNVREHGFFASWDFRTVIVATSWVCKGWTTFLVLKNLNSVLKNIGEASAILVIFLVDTFLAQVSETGREFQVPVFLLVLVIVLTVVSYSMAAKK